MDLYLCAQDIERFTCAFLEDRTICFQKTVESSPERYLFFLDQFLSECEKNLHDVKRVYVVSGPGSFTASRVSVMIANTIAFVHSAPIFSVENPENKTLEELLPFFDTLLEHTFVIPVYNRQPNIT